MREDPDFSHKPHLHLVFVGRTGKNHPNPFVRKFLHKSICRRMYLYTHILRMFLHTYLASIFAQISWKYFYTNILRVFLHKHIESISALISCRYFYTNIPTVQTFCINSTSILRERQRSYKTICHHHHYHYHHHHRHRHRHRHHLKQMLGGPGGVGPV